MASRATTRGRFTRCFTVFAVSCAAPLTALPRHALAADAPPKDPTARAEWLSAKAAAAFDDSRYLDAIRLYLDAWEASRSAAILYNVAFIYDRRLGDAELAMSYYERAAAAPDVDPALAAKAKARLIALRAELSGGPAEPTSPPDKNDKKDDEPPETSGRVGKKDPTGEPVIGRVTEHPTEREAEPEPVLLTRESPSIAPWIVVGAGGALFLGGLATGFVALGTHDDFEAARDAAEKDDLQSTGATQAVVADVLMAAGLLAAGTGLVWALLDVPRVTSGSAAPLSSWRLAPLVSGDGLGLAVGGRL